jgi:hypothetical protein
VKEITPFGCAAKLFLTRGLEHGKVHIAKSDHSSIEQFQQTCVGWRSHASKKRALGKGLKEYGFVRVS